jgi:hypothetical protein
MRVAGQRSGGERAETALFAVSVRSTAWVGRTTDALRYLHAAYPPQRLLQFYPEHRAVASRSATRKCQVGVRSVAEAPSWLELYHVRSKLFGTGAERRCQAASTPSFDGGSAPLIGVRYLFEAPKMRGPAGIQLPLSPLLTSIHQNGAVALLSLFSANLAIGLKEIDSRPLSTYAARLSR